MGSLQYVQTFHQNGHYGLPPPKKLLPNHGVTLAECILRQVEYYFSDENLPTDSFLQAQIAKDPDGFVDISVIAGFNRVRNMTSDIGTVIDALRQSKILEVSPSGTQLRKKKSLSNEHAKSIYVDNIPENSDDATIQAYFNAFGEIAAIHVNPKGFAFVTFATDDAAQAAVAFKNHPLGARVITKSEWFYTRKAKLNTKKKKAVSASVNGGPGSPGSLSPSSPGPLSPDCELPPTPVIPRSQAIQIPRSPASQHDHYKLAQGQSPDSRRSSLGGSRMMSTSPSMRIMSTSPSTRIMSTSPSTRIMSTSPSTRIMSTSPSTRIMSTSPSTRIMSTSPSAHPGGVKQPKVPDGTKGFTLIRKAMQRLAVSPPAVEMAQPS